MTTKSAVSLSSYERDEFFPDYDDLMEEREAAARERDEEIARLRFAEAELECLRGQLSGLQDENSPSRQ